jgi:hypothetical protein
MDNMMINTLGEHVSRKKEGGKIPLSRSAVSLN